MMVEVGEIVMVPGFTPYPRYGRVVHVDPEGVRVTQVQCGDPRCAAEHQHGDAVWPPAEVEGVEAYQPRASWEDGRKNSPNAVVDS